MSENGTEPERSAASTPTAGREMSIVLGVLVLGAALVLFASSQEWLALPEQASGAAGAQVAPAARALALVGLAGVVAVPATRGGWRRATGAVLALAGMGAGLATLMAEPGPDTLDAAPDAVVGIGPWWALSLLGSGGLAVAGAVIVWRCARWPAMGARYEAPGTTRQHEDAWTLLDRGEDPTTRPEQSGRED